MGAITNSRLNLSDVDSPSEQSQPLIFIVYEKHEIKLAQALKSLLQAWGFRAFFCRQEVREQATSATYRAELAENLANADLVVLLLSNGFRHSQYCQAEAGATATYKKQQIPITIPPVGLDVRRVSPVLEGWELIDGREPQAVPAQLRTRLVTAFGDRGLPKVIDIEEAFSCERAVQEALAEVIEAYRIEPPSQTHIGVWRSLTDVRTSNSIVAHIRRAVAEGTAKVAIVGVSLKYSINIVSEAINTLALDPSKPPHGPLEIELVHVDDQSHILHSLNDSIDIDSVLTYLRAGWPLRKSDWEEKCRKLGISLTVKDPKAIDYIPQQVGIRIESVMGGWSVLYAGRCSFEHAGYGTRLLVGEREYFFYTSSPEQAYGNDQDDDPWAANAIDVFNQYLVQYSSKKHNSATLVDDHNQWISRLESCVTHYPDLRELVLISNTGQRLFQLIIPALERGLSVKVYTRHPDLLSETDAVVVRAMKKHLADEILRKLGAGCLGNVELRHYRRSPTFRAALIGKAVLGLQAYTVGANTDTMSEPSADGDHQEQRGEPLVPSEMRFIVTGHSEHFESLEGMVDGFLQFAGADARPYAKFPKS